ncbi:MAG: cupin domain-containing protein [Hyphomicrobiales bacterium]|jgi:gentisate 1,2-dioxygenase|nr:cupin domain-containing protein [Xanthobacteraceae bacterium]
MSAVRPDISEIRKAWKDANLAPLWENAKAHRPAPPPEPAYLWSWHKIRPLLTAAIDIASPEVVERRVLQLVPPTHQDEQRTSRTLAANIQILLPGEKARPHRHTMNALRFVLEGSGATTIVDGKPCPMAEGDLILTPAWTWHEHIHEGELPILWLDALDVPLQQYVGTGAFEAGPAAQLPETIADAAFAVANVVPDTDYTTKEYSPVFRYPYAAAAAAVAVAPPARDGSRRVRYVNPLTGGSGMAMMDCFLVQLDAGAVTLPFRTTASSVCCVVEGSGESQVGSDTIRWNKRDIFTLPQGNRIVHKSSGGTARLFQVSDRDLYARLGLLREEYGNIAA